MATHCYVGIIEDDIVTAIYVHWDGYVDFTGRILVEYYSDPEKAKALVEKGSCSALHPDIEKIDFYGEKPIRKHAYQSWNELLYLYDMENQEWVNRIDRFKQIYRPVKDRLEEIRRTNLKQYEEYGEMIKKLLEN